MNQAAPSRKPANERKRQIADAVPYSVNHWIRVEALAILAEGKRSASEIAEILGEDVKLVAGHIRELYDSGCIEFSGTEKVGNVTERFYRALTLPYVSDEAYRAMSVDDRRDLNGAVVQGILAETVASFRAGKMDTDEDLWLLWDCMSLDAQGRREAAEELAASYERLLDIKGKSATRLCESGETGTATVVSLTGFERGRPGRPHGGYYRSPRNER